MIAFHNVTLPISGRFSSLEIRACTFSPGLTSAIVGTRGSGKAEIFLAVLGLLRPSGGALSVDGIEPSTASQFVRHKICFVPYSAPVLPHLRVIEQVQLIASLGGQQNASRREIVTALRLSEMPDRLISERCAVLSKFDRLCLWFAVHRIRGTTILLLDDPANTLPVHQAAAFRTLSRESAQSGHVVVVSSPDPMFASSLADRVWRIDHQQLIAQETRADLTAVVAPDNQP